MKYSTVQTYSGRGYTVNVSHLSVSPTWMCHFSKNSRKWISITAVSL